MGNAKGEQKGVYRPLSVIWGKITEETETVPNSIKYAGEYNDAETGFIYLRNRMYDPATRRFTSEDPARDQLNWYAYCGNNPVKC